MPSYDRNLLPRNSNLPPSAILPSAWNKTNRVLAVHLRPVGRPYGSFTARWKAARFIVWFIYGLSEGRTVHLWSVGRLYGSFTARRKAIWFILRTVNRTYCQLKAPFGRQPKRHFRRDFLRISFIFYSFIFIYFFCIL